ncbi:hypothetical protein SEUCBS139899_009023 [Sporothrix eucalyptigena]|uniref:Uncharacterized protein n=1 Tax=Sporothrix eucalyptigena TaxID=1812306 RepID=A0ABP0C282_9PEZI
MGRRENGGFRGYLVRVQTKEGRVFRHRKLRMVLDKSQNQGITLQTHRLGDPKGDIENYVDDASERASLEEGLPVIAWRSYPIKDGTRKADRTISRSQAIEETTLDEFVGLAHSRTKLPGETTGGRGVDVVDADDEQVARLYRLGILYDGPSREAPAGAADSTRPAGAADSAYQADSLDTIRHAEPLYSVRHVPGKRRGKRASASTSAAKSPLADGAGEVEAGPSTEGEGSAEIQTEEESSGGLAARDIPLFAFDGVWEDGEGQTINGRALWNDLEEFEYVVLRDDDLASMAGSWVELESVLDTEDASEV